MLTGPAFGCASCEWLHSQDLLFYLAASRFSALGCRMVPAAANLIFLKHRMWNPNLHPQPLSPCLLVSYWLWLDKNMGYTDWPETPGALVEISLLSQQWWEWRSNGFPEEISMFLLEGGKKDGTWARDTFPFFFSFCHIFSAWRMATLVYYHLFRLK